MQIGAVASNNAPHCAARVHFTSQSNIVNEETNMPNTVHQQHMDISRRGLMGAAAGIIATSALGTIAQSSATAIDGTQHSGESKMSTITTKDGANIFYKDWGRRDAQPIVFHHGWPLSADDWDNQMLFFLSKGYRVIAHDRRGHGRSSQISSGHEMDTYASDVSALTDALDLKGAVHIGHSTGGGEAVHYVARAKPGRVAKLITVGAVPPVMVKSDSNPGGLPLDVFDTLRSALASNRSQFYTELASGPFYGFNRPGAKISQGLVDNWWRQGMMGAANAHYECIKAFSETDFTEDLRKIAVPTLIAHGTDDQIVPIADSALLAIKLLKHGTLKTYEGLPHGMLSTHPETLNPDLLAFIRS